jgi:hypothetical protein
LDRNTDLFQVAGAHRRVSFLASLAQRRQQHPRQNPDDRDDDQQLNESER